MFFMRSNRANGGSRFSSDTGRGRGARLGIAVLAWSCLAAVALAMSPAMVEAQSRSGARGASGGAGLAIDVNGWVAETVMMVLASGLAFSLMFFAIYPMLLRKSNPWWPLNAYGFCLAMALTLCFAAALAIFWEDLVLKRPQQGPVGPFELYALRAGLGALWAVVTTIILSVFRSSKGRVATR